VTANLLIISLNLMSYKQMFLELPPPRIKSPFGDMDIELKCLFLVEFLAVTLSSLNLPPATSCLQSIVPIKLP